MGLIYTERFARYDEPSIGRMKKAMDKPLMYLYFMPSHYYQHNHLGHGLVFFSPLFILAYFCAIPQLSKYILLPLLLDDSLCK